MTSSCQCSNLNAERHNTVLYICMRIYIYIVMYDMYFNFAYISWDDFFFFLIDWALWFIFGLNIRLLYGILFYTFFTITYMIQFIQSQSVVQFFHNYSLNNSLWGPKMKKMKEGRKDERKEGRQCLLSRKRNTEFLYSENKVKFKAWSFYLCEAWYKR